MPKVNNNKRFKPCSSRNNDSCDFASRHSEQLLTPNVINNPVIASPSGRGNPIKSTSNDPEPMELLRRFAPHNDRLKKCAFTLAELMITIGIIGVVAAITIPLLIQNSNYKKFTTQFRKSLSTLNQAAISAQAQYDMDYGTLTSDSAPSTCATDSLSGGQSTMCGLLNNTLAGKTYMGVYGEVAGSMILTKYKFTKKTDGFDPANFLIYSMADGSIVGFNPSMKNCSLSGELTKSVLTDSNKLANCIGFVDVNGVGLPNKEVTCSDGTSALEPNNPCTLKSNGFGLGDVFPVVFHNGTVEPATNAAKAFFSGESSGGSDNEDIVFYNASGEEISRTPKYKFVNGEKYLYDNDTGIYISSNADVLGYYKDGVFYTRIGNKYYYVDSSGKLNGKYIKTNDGYELISGGVRYIYDNDMNRLGLYKNNDFYEYKPNSYDFSYTRVDANGNIINQWGATPTKTSEGYEVVNNVGTRYIYDNNLQLREMYKKGNHYMIIDSGPDGYGYDSFSNFTKTSSGYERSSGSVTYIYDNNMNPLGARGYDGNLYEYKNELYVRQDANGNYASVNGVVYKKLSNGLYFYNNHYYDKDLNRIY